MLARCQYQALTEVGVGAEVGAGGSEVGLHQGLDLHQGLIGPPPQVPGIVVGVVKDTHPRSAQPITKFVKGANSRVTSNYIVRQRTQGVPTNLGALEGNNLRYPRDLNNHLVIAQGLIMSSMRTLYILHLTKDPKHPNPTIFYLMKYQIPKY